MANWQSSVQRSNAYRAHCNPRRPQSLLSYQLEEFAALNVADGELMALETEHKRLAQAQNIRAQLAQVQSSLENLDGLRQATRVIESIDDSHSALQAQGRNPEFWSWVDR